jgi:hypothetical protein
MPTIVLSTLALLGCAFLVYVLFHWLREELDLKKPAHRDRGKKALPPPYVIRTVNRTPVDTGPAQATSPGRRFA